MATTTNTYWQLEKEYYTISSTHDLIIRVIEHQNITRIESQGTPHARTITDSVAHKVHEFKVQRAILHAASPYFAKLLSAEGGFTENNQQDIIDLHEDHSAEGVGIWFRILHSSSSCSSTTEDYGFTATTIRDVWEMLATAHKYGFDPQTSGARVWFEGWYAVHGAINGNAEGKRWDFKDYQQLLFPCYTFDHAIGFATATKYLAYRATGHITERRPEGFEYEHLRLDANILHQLNAAKGRLKTILHRALYTPIDNLLKRAHCRCKATVLYAYEQSLSDTGAWPLESAFLNTSVQNVLRDLEGFPGGPGAFVPRTCGGRWCGVDFAATVCVARAECRKYFDGLCLDCMNASNAKLGDADEDYWHHSKLNVHWDAGCRIRHAQPSWYFSFLGRRQKMVEWKQSAREHRSGSIGSGGGGGEGGNGFQETVDRVQQLSI